MENRSGMIMVDLRVHEVFPHLYDCSDVLVACGAR